MVEMNITLRLSDEQAERLEALTEAYNAAGGTSMTRERVFEMIMSVGSAQIIADRLDMLSEMTVALREHNDR